MARTKSKSKNPTQKYAKLMENPPFALLESFRNLVTNLGFAIPRKKDQLGRVVCISSAVAGEGKTTVSVNLAISCANMGAKTVLVDLDMRKPAVRRYFNVEAPEGILDYLSGQVDFENILHRDVAKNLDLIVCRRSAPNPLALIATDNFRELLARLAAEYEYVILDTPPIDIVSDALAVAEHTDGLLLVVRQMVSTHSMLQQAISSIDFAGINFLGFVLNDFNLKNAGVNYKKGYSYKYSKKYE